MTLRGHGLGHKNLYCRPNRYAPHSEHCNIADSHSSGVKTVSLRDTVDRLRSPSVSDGKRFPDLFAEIKYTL